MDKNRFERYPYTITKYGKANQSLYLQLTVFPTSDQIEPFDLLFTTSWAGICNKT